jgi:hypothetical protein
VESLCTLRVQATFADVDEQQAQAIAAAMIGRAHELANLPDCECDVDVSIQTAPSEGDGAHSSDAAPSRAGLSGAGPSGAR